MAKKQRGLFDTIKEYAKQRVFGASGAGMMGYEGAFSSPIGNSSIDFEAEAGDGHYSDIVMASVKWLMRVFPEPQLVLERRNAEDEYEIIQDHPLIERLEVPNEGYDGDLLMVSTELSFALDGNAYWWVVPSNGGGIAEIWWLPHHLVEPKGNDTRANIYIDHYEFSPPGRLPIRIDPSEIVHFRFGLDPKNVRKGLSPLQSVLREVYTDREAGEWIAGLMDNSGLPWAVVSPDPNAEMQTVQEDLLATRTYIENQLRTGKPGGVLALGAPVRLEPITVTPRQMNFKDVRRIPEERISANLGIPPIVAGLGAGLDRATYANYETAERIAYRSTLIPTYKQFARVIRRRLLPRYERDYTSLRVRFDLSDVQAFQEDETNKATRVRSDFGAGIITLSEARTERGWPVDDNMRVYLRPSSLVEVHEDDVGAPAPEPTVEPPTPSPFDDDADDDAEGDDADETPKASTNGRAKQPIYNGESLEGFSELGDYWKPYFNEN